jgi:tryptophanyl-tRNA synthetase
MRIFSGIQPTGNLHIGNYFGAIKQWIELQEENDCVFCIVDLHAITVPYDQEKLHELVMEKAIIYLAAGLDPEKVVIFVQSSVKEHTELAWLLNTITPLGELYRMTQYKEKSAKDKKNEGAGLLNYPILMAADILLYNTEVVPVGEDQKQHVELARDIAKKFNRRFGETFVLPKEKLPRTGSRIMSLSEPTKKMSKSDSNKAGSITLFDSPEEIRKKIKSAVTDTYKTIKYDKEKRPGISNLLTIYAILSEKEIKSVEKEMQGKTYKVFKEELAELVVEKLEPFRKKREEFSGRDVYVQEILKQGEERARTLAESKMNEVRKKMGLVNL